MNGSELRAKFDQEWGAWRRFIASNPLTGSWITFAAGAAVVAVAWKLFG